MDTATSKLLSSDRNLAVAIGKNTIFGIAANAAQFGTRFITVPVVIYHLGLGGYGIWAIVMATAGYMRFGSAGVKSAFQKYVAEATATGDFEEANQLLSTGSILMLVLSMAGLIPLSIYSQKLARAAGVPPNFLSAAAASITLLALIMAFSNFGAVFEGIVMGAHRIDLTRTFSIVATVGEAIAIIVLLHYGYGLFAMATTIAVSELTYVFCCFFASRRVMPKIHISISHYSNSVWRELIRFAMSYQLVNLLEVLYLLLLPVTILKYFGADFAGLFAIVGRLTKAALMGQDALILPLLSGGAMMFACGSPERLRRFLRKSFKVTLAVSLLPLAIVAAFGTLLIFVWTGQTGPEFRMAIWLICLSNFFAAISRLQLVLYRAAGNALHDNLRQAFRLCVLVILAIFGGLIGFYGILGGLVFSEAAGVAYMFFAMRVAVPQFRLKIIIPDALRLIGATALIISAGIIVVAVLPVNGTPGRATALVRLVEVLAACLVVLLPAFVFTKSITGKEQKAVLDLLTFRKGVAASS